MKELTSYLPTAMVIAFLALTLIIGMYYSRKVTSLREYTVGNKRFATPTLIATLLATAFGGGWLIRTVEEVHVQGLYFMVFMLSFPFGYWCMSPLALRMESFMRDLSLSESIGRAYGTYPRMITALAAILTSIATLAIQIRVISSAISICLGLVKQTETIPITVAATLLLIFYSSLGGIRAVTFTDVLQFITFSMIIPLLAWFMFQYTGKSIPAIIALLQNEKKFDYSFLFSSKSTMVNLGSFTLGNMAGRIYPPTIQRLYMSSSSTQAQKVLSYGSFFGLLIVLFIFLIGIFTFISAPELEKEAIWPYIIHLLPPYLKGFICMSLIAMTMSTADSELNTSSVMFVHDIVGNIKIKVEKKLFPALHPLSMARIFSLTLGFFSLLLAFKKNDLLGLLRLALCFSVPVYPAPFLLAVFGFRGSSRTALIGMATGIISILVWNKWIDPITGIDGNFPCMVANGLAMMAAHYLLPKQKGVGWVAPDDEFKQLQQAHIRRKNRIKAEISTPLLLGSLLVIVINLILLIFTKVPIYFPLSFLFIGIGLAAYAIKLRQ